MNFKQKWNSQLQKIADEFFTKLEATFGIGYSEENLDANITKLFPTYGERTQFFTFLDQNYKLNIRSNYEQEHIDGLIYRLYVREVSAWFEKNGISNEYTTDFELLKMYISKPDKRSIDSHILKALSQGYLFCANEEYVCIQWCPRLLSTDVILKIVDDGYEVVSVYPGCYEGNRQENGVWYPDDYEIGDNTEMSVGSNPYDFFDSHVVFEKEGFGENSEPEYSYYGFAIAANVDFHSYLKEKELTFSYLEYDCISDEVNPFQTVRTKLKDLMEFTHLGKKFYMFKWNGCGNDKDDTGVFDEDIPVFIPAKLLPKGTELFDEDEIELQIFLCGHQAVYCNPKEPHFDSMKFDVIAHLSGVRIKSRAQIKEEKIAWQYEFPKPEKKTLELKKKPAEYMIRIFDEKKTYEEQVIEQCELFNEKHGVYPNVIVANAKTFDAWEEAIENSIADSMATDKDYPVDEDGQATLFDLNDDEPSDFGEFGPDESGKGTLFFTSKFSLHLVENEDFQESVYEILNGYSPQLEENCFIYPVVDAEATGKRIREVMNDQEITPTMIQKVLGGVSLQGIYKWFNGQAMPKLDSFAVISNMLNTPIDDLIVVKNQKREPFI